MRYACGSTESSDPYEYGWVLTHRRIKGPPPPPRGGADGGGGGNPDGWGASRRASFTALFVLLAASTMVFAAFTSAFVVRRGLSDDWVAMHKPPILLGEHRGAAGLAASLLELARRALQGGRAHALQSLVDAPARCWAFCFWSGRRWPGVS